MVLLGELNAREAGCINLRSRARRANSVEAVRAHLDSRYSEKCGTLRGRRRVRLVIPSGSAPADRRLLWITHVAPAVVYVGAIFYAGLIRLAKLPEVGFMPTDKLLHAVTFGGLAVLLVRATRALLPRLNSRRRLFLALFLASLVGALLEVCQAFVPYRSAEFLDWLADTIGAAAATALFALLPSRISGVSHG
jgi:VanZ family protein